MTLRVIHPYSHFSYSHTSGQVYNGNEHVRSLPTGPKAEQSKSSDLDCGWGDPGSNLGKGMCFFLDCELSGSHVACSHTW